MRCPYCGNELGDGMLPARCPRCGHNFSNATDRPGGAHGASRAAASRACIEGISGFGRGRRDASHVVKRVVRIVLGLALAAAFSGLVYLALYQAQIVGGVVVPDVTGWGADQATAQLADKGLSSSVVEAQSAEQAAGRVVSTNPPAGTRVGRGASVTVSVAAAAR